MDFAPTPSTLLCVLTFQSTTLTIVDCRNYYYNQTYQQIESYLKPIHPPGYHKNLVEWRRRNTNKATAPASGDRSCEDNE